MMRLCERALNFLQIIDYKGTVRLCGWIMNNEIGSLSDQSMLDIWNGEKAWAIRNKLIREDYSDCVVDGCPFCAMDMHDEHFAEIDELPEYPTDLYLAYEETCNYACTSCTTPEVMRGANRAELEEGYRNIEEKLKDILPHVNHISANGRGELFASPHILKLLSEWKPLSPEPECRVSLETNGSLFDEKHWKQIEKLGKYNLRVAITIMSFDEKAYQYLSGTKLPVSRIEDNLRFVKSLREKGVIDHIELATVYQERNFRFLPEFTKRCIEEFGADEVRLRPYMPWGSRSPEIEWFYDIRNPAHPYYMEFVEIMKDPIFKHPKVSEWGGGRNSNANRYAPWDKPKKKEILIGEALDASSVIERIPVEYRKKILLYGLSDAAKVLTDRLRQIGIVPMAILDKSGMAGEYEGIPVVKPASYTGDKQGVSVIVTVWNGYRDIREYLTECGYEAEGIISLEREG